MWRGLMLTKAVEQFLRDVALGRARLPAHRHAAGHRRRADGPGADAAAHRPADRHHAGARPPRRWPQRAADMARRSFLRVVGVIENMTVVHVRPRRRATPCSASAAAQALADEIGVAAARPDPARAGRRRPAATPAARWPSTGAGPAAAAFARIATALDDVAPHRLAEPDDMAGCSARLLAAVDAALDADTPARPLTARSIRVFRRIRVLGCGSGRAAALGCAETLGSGRSRSS